MATDMQDQDSQAASESPISLESLSIRPRSSLNLSSTARADLSLLQSGRFADAEIACGGARWSVHKAILCTRSDWFLRALDIDYQGDTPEEVPVYEVDYDRDTMECLLMFIYTQNLQLARMRLFELKKANVWRAGVILWSAGDFFQLPTLASGALEMMDGWGRHVRTTMCVVNSPFEYYTECLEEGVRAAFEEFPQAKPCQKLLLDLFYDGRLRMFNEPSFNTLVDEVPAFAGDMFKAVLDWQNAGKYCGGIADMATPDLIRCVICNEHIFNTSPPRQAVYFIEKAMVNSQASWRFRCTSCPNFGDLPWEPIPDLI